MNVQDLLWQPLPMCGDGRLRRWLLDRGSLTQRIQARCGDFRLDVLWQRTAACRFDEAAVIGLKTRARCLAREVSLNCGSEPLVFAHTVAPLRALNGPWRMLNRFGARPLGAALFADPCIKRHPLRFHHLNWHHPLYPRAALLLRDPPMTLWARRSLFVLNGAPLLVTEVFLPAILALAP
jgi:chorismate--pyruvate lyase